LGFIAQHYSHLGGFNGGTFMGAGAAVVVAARAVTVAMLEQVMEVFGVVTSIDAASLWRSCCLV
jgi:hypothetical protein